MSSSTGGPGRKAARGRRAVFPPRAQGEPSMSNALPTPQYARNMKLIGHSDQGGRPDAVQVMVERGFAYVGHLFANGFSVIDVRDPRNPKPGEYFPAPPNIWN